jgi:signal peptidase I
MTPPGHAVLTKPNPFRFLFVGLWFVLVPALAAYAVVQLLRGDPDDLTVGYLRSFVRDQPIPAGIILFTVFEMSLWRFRHELPLAAHLSVGGRTGLPASLRRDYEAAAQLLDEADRILNKHRKAVERDVPASERRELEERLKDLRVQMDAESFDEVQFRNAFAKVTHTSARLDAWRKGELREYVESIGFAILVALLLRAVVVEAFKIPSGSMLPTLQIEDHIFVNKFVYGPTIPLTRTRLFPRMPPVRGDVIVFEFPDDDPSATPQDYIKRVVAVPGDILEAEGGHPIINGFRVPFCRAGTYDRPDRRSFSVGSLELHVEFLGEHSYLTLIDPMHDQEREGPYEVAPGEVWVFGDNRHNSSDSRAWHGGKGGGVPYANVKGRALFVWLPLSRLFVNVMGSPQLPEGAPPELVRGAAECLRKRPPLSETTPPPARAGR